VLFQRIFNWIKYKTLPASFLFRNRLYVERDSKHKKIFSNFGSHFKGSKWSFYTSYSIKTLFKIKYVKFAIKALIYLFIFLVFFFYNKYYIKMPLFNSFIYLIWACADCSHYYITFVSWWIFVGVIKFFNFIYSLCVFNNFSKKKNTSFLNRPFSDFDLPEESIYKKKFISKEDVNYYSNLWVNVTKTPAKLPVVENLFNNEANNHRWAQKYNLFNSMYSFTSFTDKVSSGIVSYRVNRKLNKILSENCSGSYLKLDQYIAQTDFYTSHLSLCFMFFFKRETYFETASKKFNSTRLLDQKNNWNLYSILKEQEKTTFLKKSKIGSFFFKQHTQKEILDYVMNGDDLKTIEVNVKSALQGSKFQRWLYRYSILHRKSLKFTNKILAGKKNFVQASFNEDLYGNNLWKNFSKLQQYKFFLSNTASDTKSRENSVNLGSAVKEKYTEQNARSSTFYESSYLWLIKRFYFFNSSKSNKLTSKFATSSVDNSRSLNDKNNSLKTYLYLLNLLNKPSVTASAMYSLDENHESNAAYLDNISFLMQANQTLKDIYVPSSESTLLNSELIKISLIGYNATNESSPASFANFLLLQNTLLTPKVDFINNLAWADSLATAYMYDEKNIDNLFLKDLSKLIDNL